MDPELASKLIKNARDATITAAIMIAVVVGFLNKDDIMASVVAMTNRMQTASAIPSFFTQPRMFE
jgi:urease gamma subunit